MDQRQDNSGSSRKRTVSFKRKAVFACAAVLMTSVAIQTSAGGSESKNLVPLTVDLVAQGAVDAGDISIWKCKKSVFVRYVTEDTWTMSLTHLEVASSLEDIPQESGSPLPGRFEFVTHHNPAVTEYLYEVPIETGSHGVLYIAAHACVGREEKMVVASEIGDKVYGPVYEQLPIGDIGWGEANPALEAKNWIGIVDNPIIPGYVHGDIEYSWGTGTYTDIPGVDWISTSMNTEEWWVDTWRWFEKDFIVPGNPVSAEVRVNSDNDYLLEINDQLIGEDGYTFGPPLDPLGSTAIETYSVYLMPGTNVIDCVVLNLAHMTPDDLRWQIGNPNGLTYELRIDYWCEEGAWGAGTLFPGSDWATYIEF